MKYAIMASVKISDFSDKIKEVETNINETMHGFGFHENIVITSEIEMYSLVVDEILDESKKIEIIKILQKILDEKSVKLTVTRIVNKD